MADDSRPTLDGVAACVMGCEPLIWDSLGMSRREVAALAFGLASKKFVDRATTEGEQE